MSQADLSRVIPLTTRQIRNLERSGLPHRAEGNRKYYPLHECVRWWAEYEKTKAMKAAKLSELDAMRTRKLEVEAEQKELELAVRRGELLEADEVRATWTEVLSRLRARIVAAQGALPPLVAGYDTPREVQPIVTTFFDELIDTLRETAEGVGADAA